MNPSYDRGIVVHLLHLRLRGAHPGGLRLHPQAVRGPDKGIERLLAEAGIRYLSLPELGNPFRSAPDWKERSTPHEPNRGTARQGNDSSPPFADLVGDDAPLAFVDELPT
jgi:hypothetical protein